MPSRIKVCALLLALGPALTVPSKCFPQGVQEETEGARAARRDAVRAVREGYSAAIRARPARTLPVGVFDSGTGGLAVLEEVLRLDQFDNASGASRPGGDGRPDFEAEQFVFLADQANLNFRKFHAAQTARFR